MARDRRRLIHTSIGRDPKFTRLVNDYGPSIGIFYILLIPATSDDGIVYDATPEGLKLDIVPGFDFISSDDISTFLVILHNRDFIYWDQEQERIIFDVERYYKHQNNIPKERHRQPQDIILPKTVLKSTHRVASAETWKKFEEVWKLVPQKSKGRWTQHQIKQAIQMYDSLSLDEVVMAMLSVLEKFDGQRSDMGFLFGNALKWKLERNESGDTTLAGAVTPQEYERDYKNLKATSEEKLGETLDELDRMLEQSGVK